MTNPYSPGIAEAETPVPQGVLEDITDMETAKKLYKASRIIKLFAFLNFFGLLFLLLAFGLSLGTDMSKTGQPLQRWLYPVVLLFITAIQALFFYSLANRPSWGRIVIIVISAIQLINIPIGTILGAIIIWAATVGSKLFGDNKITHAELKQINQNGLPGSVHQL